MLTEKEIIELYEKYEKDFNCNLPTLIITQEFINQINSIIENIDKDNAYITIGKEFNCANRNKRYIESVLYHEFTHIYDHATLFKDIDNFQEKTNYLFPYTEIHAIIIETKYNLGLIYNPKKDIGLSSILYSEDSSRKLKDYLQEIYEGSERFFEKIEWNEDNVHAALMNIAYYIGISVFLEEYNLNNPYSIKFPKEWDIDEEFNQVKTLYQNNEITENLCKEMNSLANEIANKIYYYYNDSPATE